MARELLISCDRCRFELDKRSEAMARTVGIDGKDFILDLCEDCDAEVLGVLRALTTEYGMPVEDVTPTAAAGPPKRRPRTLTDEVRNRERRMKRKQQLVTVPAETAPTASADESPAPVLAPAPAPPPPAGQRHKIEKGKKSERVLVQTVGKGRQGAKLMGPQQIAAGYPVRCLWCPRELYASQDVGSHLKGTHGAASTFDVWGHDCPLCGETGFTRVANHVMTVHVQDMNNAVRSALEQGDIFGYAKRIMNSVKVGVQR